MAQENLKPLKTLVFSMGIVLIAGTVLLFGLVLKKISKEPAAPVHALAACPGGNVNLKGRGAFVDSVVTGDVMRVTLEKRPGQSQTVTIDICSGKIMGTLSLETDPAINEQEQ